MYLDLNWYFLAGYCVLADFDHLLRVQYCNSLDISLGLVYFVCFLEFIKFFIWLSFAFYFEQKQIKPNFFHNIHQKKFNTDANPWLVITKKYWVLLVFVFGTNPGTWVVRGKTVLLVLYIRIILIYNILNQTYIQDLYNIIWQTHI